jgi:hypothetical protein
VIVLAYSLLSLSSESHAHSLRFSPFASNREWEAAYGDVVETQDMRKLFCGD